MVIVTSITLDYSSLGWLRQILSILVKLFMDNIDMEIMWRQYKENLYQNWLKSNYKASGWSRFVLITLTALAYLTIYINKIQIKKITIRKKGIQQWWIKHKMCI